MLYVIWVKISNFMVGQLFEGACYLPVNCCCSINTSVSLFHAILFITNQNSHSIKSIKIDQIRVIYGIVIIFSLASQYTSIVNHSAFVI